jgi:hypothetical protein
VRLFVGNGVAPEMNSKSPGAAIRIVGMSDFRAGSVWILPIGGCPVRS